MSKLADKVAIVTGASKGIGAGIAKELAAAGARVVVNYAGSKDGADKVVAQIIAAGGKAIAVQADVSKSVDIARLFDGTKAAHGALDILVNNAGVYKWSPLEEVTEEEFHRQFNINVLAPILVTQESLKHFGAKGGSVINIGSVISASPMPHSLVYAATKGAVDVTTRVLGKELGARNIRVNSINPGLVETEGTVTSGFSGADFQKPIVAQTPLGRIGSPKDIADIAVFLASDESRWMTAELLIASGGFR